MMWARRNSKTCSAPLSEIFIFMHLADAFIQSDLQCIQVIPVHVLSACVFPGNRTHNLCAANAML